MEETLCRTKAPNIIRKPPSITRTLLTTIAKQQNITRQGHQRRVLITPMLRMVTRLMLVIMLMKLQSIMLTSTVAQRTSSSLAWSKRIGPTGAIRRGFLGIQRT
jgi:hypothetical protein